jgi:hypothetical protein
MASDPQKIRDLVEDIMRDENGENKELTILKGKLETTIVLIHSLFSEYRKKSGELTTLQSDLRAVGNKEGIQQEILKIEANILLIKDTVKEFIEAAHFIENAPISFFYEKEIGLFNMYMWHVRDSVLDIMKLWLRRNTEKDQQGNHIVKVGQDDPIMNGCVSIIKAIRRAALKTGTTIIPPTSSDDVITIKMKSGYKIEDLINEYPQLLKLERSNILGYHDVYCDVINSHELFKVINNLAKREDVLMVKPNVFGRLA